MRNTAMELRAIQKECRHNHLKKRDIYIIIRNFIEILQKPKQCKEAERDERCWSTSDNVMLKHTHMCIYRVQKVPKAINKD